jgi:hypothetical protein
MAHMIFAVAVAVGYLTFRLPAAAADVAAWCAVIKDGDYWDCQYRSLEDCRPNVLAGNRGWCNPNPYFVATPTDHRGGTKPANSRSRLGEGNRRADAQSQC